MKLVARSGLLAALLLGSAASLALTGCGAAEDAGTESAAGPDDRELAQMGGAGAFALTEGGAYYVAGGALHRVDADGRDERLADAPARTGAIAATARWVVVAAAAASQGQGARLTFYDRQDGHAAHDVALRSAAVEVVPAFDADHVAVSTLDHGLLLIGGAGDQRTVFGTGATLRNVQGGEDAKVIFAVANRYGDQRQLLAIDLRNDLARAVFDIGLGSFEYTYDAETDLFFTVRSHVSFARGAVLAVYAGNGRTVASVETPLETRGAMASDADGFYMAQRSSGSGAWKLVAYDKKTLSSSEMGEVAPQVAALALQGKQVFYSHTRDTAQQLRVRPLAPVTGG